MARSVKRPHIGKNQRKILQILEKYEELTAKDIAEILWARDIRYKTPEYSSAHRSLTALHKKGLVEKVKPSQLKWRASYKSPIGYSSRNSSEA
jgi:predicted transcriptional regulator